MTGQTIGQAVVARKTDPASQVADQVRHYSDEFAQVLPSHFEPKVFTRLAVSAIKRSPDLAQRAGQNPASLMHALLEAASLGLKPGTEEYYLTPRGGKEPGVLGITGYQGEIELIYRAGAVSSIKHGVVRERDVFEWDAQTMDRPLHRYSPWDTEEQRGEVLGAYAYCEMVNGGVSQVVFAGPIEIERAKKASATADKSFSPWNTDYPAMVLKTALHQLKKWVPTSAEYRKEQLRAVAEVHAETQPVRHAGHVDTETGEIIDGESGEIIDGEVME